MKFEKIVSKILTRPPREVTFSEALLVATRYFGEPRIRGSHYIFTVPNNRPFNLQNANGKAKPYQVRQLAELIRETNR